MNRNSSVNGNGGRSGGNQLGPCGACKFLRRKCVKGCIFAPYFDSEQGSTHFAAVHKIFGASNVSKLLLRLPSHKRLDAVVTICYEALARIRDPVYGCVGHIFALQQQVVNLQAELAFVQAHLSTYELSSQAMSPALANIYDPNSSTNTVLSTSNVPTNFATEHPQLQQTFETTAGYCSLNDQQHTAIDDCDIHTLAREFVSRYLPGVRFRPPSSSC
ncbi:Lob domain-containing protein [Thalictrum thalictroides]|uniref:Lob domain-containing protein n=1 Tax=Thalictrum thalictroides TaxID=46969 RepID=A0A7J6WUL0_THATH|nr:Lob domain-containing protein [Thalictrum thalictroides]